MPDQPRPQGSFRVQYAELSAGALRISYVIDNVLESGDIELERPDAEELVALLNRATTILHRGRMGTLQAPSAATQTFSVAPDEEADHRIPPLRTDPAALRRKRRTTEK
jgi:hypothetical protein